MKSALFTGKTPWVELVCIFGIVSRKVVGQYKCSAIFKLRFITPKCYDNCVNFQFTKSELKKFVFNRHRSVVKLFWNSRYGLLSVISSYSINCLTQSSLTAESSPSYGEYCLTIVKYLISWIHNTFIRDVLFVCKQHRIHNYICCFEIFAFHTEMSSQDILQIQ